MASKLNGVEQIARARLNQLVKGYSAGHDKYHVNNELIKAAECYLWAARYAKVADGSLYPLPTTWPWYKEDWKPSADPAKNLAKAGALLAAEIDRLQRERE